MEQEPLTLPEHVSSPTVFSRVRVTRSLVLCACFVDRWLSFCTFSVGLCVVCSSSTYGVWLPFWYPQAPFKLCEQRNDNYVYISTPICRLQYKTMWTMCNNISERKDNCTCILTQQTFKKVKLCIRWVTYSVKLYLQITSEYLDKLPHFAMFLF